MLSFDFLHLKPDEGDIKVFCGVFGEKRMGAHNILKLVPSFS